jgi:hypothetical protein
MKKITQEELDQILQQHQLWLDSNEAEGKCADLQDTNLRYATSKAPTSTTPSKAPTSKAPTSMVRTSPALTYVVPSSAPTSGTV